MMNNSKHVRGVHNVPARNCWVIVVTREYLLYQRLLTTSKTSLHVQEREDACVLGVSLYTIMMVTTDITYLRRHQLNHLLTGRPVTFATQCCLEGVRVVKVLQGL